MSLFEEVKNIELFFESLLKFHHPVHARGIVPAMDIYEGEDKLYVLIEAPGVKPEEIKVRVEGDIMIIYGRKENPFEIKGKNMHHYMEIEFGEFERRIKLPCEIETHEVIAERKNGFILLIFPKKKRIERVIEIE